MPTTFKVKRDVTIRAYDESKNLYKLMVDKAHQEQSKGRPVLIILDSINATNLMKQQVTDANLIQGINPENDRKSIEKAGHSGTITISTIAAGLHVRVSVFGVKVVPAVGQKRLYHRR